MKKAAAILPATLRDVATAANVSVATVSRALNLPDMLAPETLARVRTAIAETGYVPTMMSAGVATNRSRLVAVMLAQGPLQVFEETLRALTARLNEHGYQAMLALLPADERDHALAFSQLLSRRPESLACIGVPPAVIPPSIRDLALPLVQLWELPQHRLDMVVGINHQDIGASLGRLVLQKGWRRPLVVQYAGTHSFDRRSALTRCLVEVGRPEPMLSATFAPPGGVADGRGALAAALESGDTPDVAICMSDWLAFGVLEEARARGMRVPQDLAIVGYGDFPFAPHISPALTTIRIDGERMGQEAATMLVASMAGQDPGERIRDIGFTLIERETT